MIKKLKIKNFKSHLKTELKLVNINLFAGINGMGKSSVIQALLLLRQTYQKNMLNEGIELNGQLCNIGVGKDAIYQSAEQDIISFNIDCDNKEYLWSFNINDKRLADTFLKKENKKSYEVSELKKLSIFNNNFQYISVFRNGPVQSYEKDTSTVEIFKQISKKEGRCELIAHYLDYFGNESIADESLKKNPEEDASLIIQVEKWLQDISPKIKLYLEKFETGYNIKYSYTRGINKAETEKFKALNIGFGISYTLPIIIAALHSRKNGIVIIENPEAHIHPSAQSKLMELLCKAAKAGIQFIIETHSDHIINGLLVAVKKEIIDKKNAAVYYFGRDTSSHATKTVHLPILKGGKIKNPPEGFFDQIDKDMEALIGF